MALWNLLTAENKISETMDDLKIKKAALRSEIEEMVKSKMEEEYNKSFPDIIKNPDSYKKYNKIVTELYGKYLHIIEGQIEKFIKLQEQLGINQL